METINNFLCNACFTTDFDYLIQIQNTEQKVCSTCYVIYLNEPKKICFSCTSYYSRKWHKKENKDICSKCYENNKICCECNTGYSHLWIKSKTKIGEYVCQSCYKKSRINLYNCSSCRINCANSWFKNPLNKNKHICDRCYRLIKSKKTQSIKKSKKQPTKISTKISTKICLDITETVEEIFFDENYLTLM